MKGAPNNSINFIWDLTRVNKHFFKKCNVDYCNTQKYNTIIYFNYHNRTFCRSCIVINSLIFGFHNLVVANIYNLILKCLICNNDIFYRDDTLHIVFNEFVHSVCAGRMEETFCKINKRVNEIDEVSKLQTQKRHRYFRSNKSNESSITKWNEIKRWNVKRCNWICTVYECIIRLPWPNIKKC